jgi:hypothetical protein
MAFLLHDKATGKCSHGASAKPVIGNPRVRLGGQPVLTVASPFTVASCPNMVGSVKFPCVIGVFGKGATRVKVMGQPVLLDTSKATNLPTGASTTITSTQARVKGI